MLFSIEYSSERKRKSVVKRKAVCVKKNAFLVNLYLCIIIIYKCEIIPLNFEFNELISTREILSCQLLLINYIIIY